MDLIYCMCCLFMFVFLLFVGISHCSFIFVLEILGTFTKCGTFLCVCLEKPTECVAGWWSYRKEMFQQQTSLHKSVMSC